MMLVLTIRIKISFQFEEKYLCLQSKVKNLQTFQFSGLSRIKMGMH